MLRNPGLRKSVEQPVLDLNFAASQIGSNGAPDGRIDFSRGNNAWFVDSDGLVKKSPHNLLLQSEDLTTVSFTKSNVTVTNNAASAPDGTTTATKLEKTANSFANVNQNFGGTTATHAASLYIKAGTNTTATILLTSDNGSTSNSRHTIDLSAGTITDISSSSMVTTTIEDVGNGWYRFTTIATFANSTSTRLYIYPDVYNSSNAGFIYIWHPQVSQHTTLPVDNPYLKTEGSAVYAARLDHDPSWFMSAAQEQNLFLYSEMVDDTYWTKTNASVTANAATDPLGGTTAEELVENTASSTHFVASDEQFFVTDGTQYTFSAYVKRGSGERDVRLWFTGANSAFAGSTAIFDLEAGTVDNESCDAVSIEDVGDGWFRVSATETATATAQPDVRINLVNNASSYTGDGASGVFVWGIQFEVGSTASTYHRTEGAPYYGPGATPKGLLIEEQRANLATDSEDFTAASWSTTNSTVTANQVLAPDGTTTADLWTRSSTSSAYLNDDVTKSAVSQDYSVSCFVKKSVGDYAAVRFQSTYPARVDGVFNLSTGAVHSLNAVTLTNEAATIEDYGNGWFRCTVSGTSDATVVLRAAVSFNSNGVQVDFTDTASDSAGFVWGFQIEEGSFPTSYIKNSGTPAGVTRNADVATMGPTTGGTELVTNGTFDTDTSGWTLSSSAGVTASISSSGATLTCSTATGSALLYQDTQRTPTVIGRRYRASADFTVNSGDGVNLVAYSGSFSGGLGSANITSGSSTVSFDFTATTTSTQIAISRRSTFADTDEYVVDNVSVRELYPFEQYNPAEGTVVCEFDCVSANTKGPFHFYEGTVFRGWGIRVISASGTQIDGISRDASGFNNATVSFVNVSNLTRAVASVNSSGHMVAGGSGNSGSNTGNTVSLPVDRLDIGSSNIGGSNTGTMSGHIRRLKYSTRFVTELEAKNLTDD